METTDLKNIWKSETEKNIKPYSENELRKMIVDATRKALRHVYPIWRLIALPAFIGYVIWCMYYWGGDQQLIIVYSCMLLIIITSFVTMLYSRWKMTKENNDMTTKEWLKFRVDAMEQSHRRKSKYGKLFYGGAFILIMIFFNIFIRFYNNTDVPTFIIIGIVASTIFVLSYIQQRAEMKKYKKVIETLKDLYKQFEEE